MATAANRQAPLARERRDTRDTASRRDPPTHPPLLDVLHGRVRAELERLERVQVLPLVVVLQQPVHLLLGRAQLLVRVLVVEHALDLLGRRCGLRLLPLNLGEKGRQRVARSVPRHRGACADLRRFRCVGFSLRLEGVLPLEALLLGRPLQARLPPAFPPVRLRRLLRRGEAGLQAAVAGVDSEASL